MEKLENQPIGSIKFNRWKIGEGEEQTNQLEIESIASVYNRIKNFFDEIMLKYSA